MGKKYAKRYSNSNIHTSLYGKGLPTFGARISHMGGVAYISPQLNVQHVKNVLISTGYTGRFTTNKNQANYIIMPGSTIGATYSNGIHTTWQF